MRKMKCILTVVLSLAFLCELCSAYAVIGGSPDTTTGSPDTTSGSPDTTSASPVPTKPEEGEYCWISKEGRFVECNAENSKLPNDLKDLKEKSGGDYICLNVTYTTGTFIFKKSHVIEQCAIELDEESEGKCKSADGKNSLQTCSSMKCTPGHDLPPTPNPTKDSSSTSNSPTQSSQTSNPTSEPSPATTPQPNGAITTSTIKPLVLGILLVLLFSS